MSIAVEFQNVSKSFKVWQERPAKDLKTLITRGIKNNSSSYTTILDDVSFNIRQGEFVGIMGRNGIGKSTILKLISGIYHPNQGRIRTHGAIAPLLELGAGFNDELSGYENIFLNAAILGFGRAKTLSLVDKIIDFSELGEKISHTVRNYSSGMLIRLGFSIAAFLDAPIVLLDEVLGVGDAGFQEKSTRMVHEMHQAGRTIILVTHTPGHVSTHCTRCILIEDKKILFDGSPGRGSELYLQTILGNPSTARSASESHPPGAAQLGI